MSATPASPSGRRAGRILALLLGLGLLGGALVVGSLRLVKAQCELCVEFRGRTTCRTGSGATPADAQRAAQRAACAVMASGMDESIACQNQPPTSVRCEGR